MRCACARRHAASGALVFAFMPPGASFPEEAARLIAHLLEAEQAKHTWAGQVHDVALLHQPAHALLPFAPGAGRHAREEPAPRPPPPHRSSCR